MLFVKYFLEPEVVSNTLYKNNTNVMIMLRQSLSIEYDWRVMQSFQEFQAGFLLRIGVAYKMGFMYVKDCSLNLFGRGQTTNRYYWSSCSYELPILRINLQYLSTCLGTSRASFFVVDIAKEWILKRSNKKRHMRFSERGTFPNPWYAQVRVRIRG